MQNQLIGQRYRIKGLIGEGGMASVYAAMDEKLDRRVAIKILHAHLGRNPDIRERFLLEAKTVSTLDHPNIIKVYDFSGLESEQLWIVTEILYGVDLAEFVKRFSKQRLHPIVATLVCREISRALAEVHKLQIVHRDIKPENIMLLESGHVKLMDFGIAKVHRAKATQTGTFMGSPSYMSPEQIRGTDVDIRADIYSLCVLYYEILTGSLPYAGQSTAEVINKIMVGRYTPPNLINPEIPYAINEVVVRGMQSHKEHRFRDVQDMCQTLDQFLHGYGFGESRHELEQFVLNRSAFEERLSHIRLPKSVHPHRASEATQHLEPGFHKTVPLQPSPASSHTRPPRTVAPHQDGEHPARTRAPRNLTPHQDGDHDPQLSRAQTQHRSHAHSAGAHRAPTHAPISEHHSAQAPMPARHKTQTPTSAHQATVPPMSGSDYGQSPDVPYEDYGYSSSYPYPQHPRHTQYPPHSYPSQHPAPYPPHSQHSHQTYNPRAFRRHPKQAVHGVYDIADIPSRGVSRSTAVLIGLIAAIILVLVFGGERLSNRIKRDTGRVTQQLDEGGKKKKRPDESTLADKGLVSPPGAPGTLTHPPVIESQTTQLDGSARNPPKVTTRDITTPKNSRNIPGSTRTVAVNSSGSLKPNSTSGSLPANPASASASLPTPPSQTSNNTRPTSRPGPDIAMIPETNKANLPPDRIERPGNDTLPSERPSRKEAGFLKVASLPAAEILVDGKLLGTTNDSGVIKLDPGNYQLRLRRKGYKAEEQSITIRPGETKSLNVSLVKSLDLVEFNIRTNRIPTSLVVEDLRDGGRRLEMVLSKYTYVLNLKPGKYRVLVNYDQTVINRVIELGEGERSITFNAEFK